MVYGVTRFSQPATMTTPTYKICLNDWNGDVLKHFSKRIGAYQKGDTRKQQFIDGIAGVVTRKPREFIALLDETERNFLAETLHRGSVPAAAAFRAKYGASRPRLDGNGYLRGETPALVTCVLQYDRDVREIRVHPSLVSLLKPLVPEPEAPAVQSLSGPPEEHRGREVRIYEGERAAPIELNRVLRLVSLGRIGIAPRSGRPNGSSVRALTEALVEPDFALEAPANERDRFTDSAGPVRAHAWGVLVQQCGWAKPKGGKLALTAAGREILSRFSPEAFRRGFERFLVDGGFDELNRVNHLRGQSGKAKRYLNPPGMRRHDFADHADCWPVGKWLAFDEAFRFIEAASGGCSIYENERAFLYLGEARYGAIYESRPIDRQFFRAFFMESLATLGILDIAYVHPHDLWPELDDAWGRDMHSFLGRYDGLLAVRLNNWGAYCLDPTASYSAAPPEESPRLQLLPNQEITALQELSAPDLALLELIAVRKSDHVWKLDVSTLLKSVESGVSLEEIRNFLAASTRNGIPANVVRWLEELETKAFSCKDAQPATVFSWRDPEQAVTVANSPGTGKLCRHLSGNRLIVLDHDLNAFANAARKQGFLLPQK